MILNLILNISSVSVVTGGSDGIGRAYAEEVTTKPHIYKLFYDNIDVRLDIRLVQ